MSLYTLSSLATVTVSTTSGGTAQKVQLYDNTKQIVMVNRSSAVGYLAFFLPLGSTLANLNTIAEQCIRVPVSGTYTLTIGTIQNRCGGGYGDFYVQCETGPGTHQLAVIQVMGNE